MSVTVVLELLFVVFWGLGGFWGACYPGSGSGLLGSGRGLEWEPGQGYTQ